MLQSAQQLAQRGHRLLQRSIPALGLVEQLGLQQYRGTVLFQAMPNKGMEDIIAADRGQISPRPAAAATTQRTAASQSAQP